MKQDLQDFRIGRIREYMRFIFFLQVKFPTRLLKIGVSLGVHYNPTLWNEYLLD